MNPLHDEGTLARSTTRGPRLYYFATRPAETPRAVVGLLPGYADYGKRYQHVVEAWAERGIASVALDLRGHGRAEGARGFCRRFGEYLDDGAELVRAVTERAAGAPAFLFGHSFGGLVAASLGIARPSPWRGLVLSAPFFGLAMDVPRAKIVAGKIASRVFPRLGIPSGLHGDDLTHDAVRARAYDQDPLVFKEATARWFTESQRAQDRAIARAPSLSLPLYVAMGTEDRVARLSRAREFFDAAGSADKTWEQYPGLFHEILNEPGWRPIADKMAEWMLARLA